MHFIVEQQRVPGDVLFALASQFFAVDVVVQCIASLLSIGLSSGQKPIGHHHG
jgi:hypothetical protein